MDEIDYLNELSGEAVGLSMAYRSNLSRQYCYVQTKRNSDMVKSIFESFLMKKSDRLDINIYGAEKPY